MIKEFVGKVVWLEDSKNFSGRGVILEPGEMGKVLPFTFDKLEGYKDGQAPAELLQFSPKGLHVGLVVKFRAEIGLIILSVSPLHFRY